MHLLIQSGSHTEALATLWSWVIVIGGGYGFVRLIRDCWRELRNREVPKMRYTREEWDALEHQKPPAEPPAV